MLSFLILILKASLYFSLVLVSGLFAFKLWLSPAVGVCKCKVKLHGKVALVTGGNSGIGLETARDLAKRGARVIIACRNEQKSKEAVADIIKTTGNCNVEYKFLDLSKFCNIRKFVDGFNKAFDRLDILVNNAGVAGLKQAVSEDGIERIMHVNFVGPFLLTNLLLYKLIASKPSRIVIVSSYANRCHSLDVNDIVGERPLGFWSRYANSKVCNILWAKALAKRLPEGVSVNAVEPGLVKTDIFKRLPTIRRKITLLVIDLLFKTAFEGAQTSIHVAVAPELEGVTGEFFSECKISDSADKVTKDDVIVERVWNETKLLIKDI
jgi:NAD(P)-dependent dehydrogenase (short-subunit alcohol dehydrogenase family)